MYNANDVNPGGASISQLTGNLRWHNGALEQERAHHRIDRHGYAVAGHTNWEPVPTVNDETTEVEER